MDNWSEIEYLTEKDLSYFRKKAEKGEAVILEIPPELLRSMDIAGLLEDDAAGKKLARDDIEALRKETAHHFPTPCREVRLYNERKTKMEEEKSAVKYEKKLMTIDEFCKYVGIGKTKARELTANPCCKYAVRIGRKVFVHKELFDEELKKSAKFQLTI